MNSASIPPPLLATHRNALNRTGFTLIELLTVITIIGILAAIIIPTVSKVRGTARRAQCASNVRQIAMAMLMFANDNKGALPLPGNITAPRWDAKISSYLDVKADANGNPLIYSEILKCPVDPRPLVIDEAQKQWARSYTLMRVPATTADTWAGGMGLFGAVNGKEVSRNLSELAAASKSALFAEHFTDGSGQVFSTQQFQFAGPQCVIDGSPSGKLNGEFYHGRVINVAFADGHVSAMPPGRIRSPYDHFRAF